MSLSIGELVGYVKLDKTQFDKGLDGAEKKFGAFGGFIGKAAKAAAGAAVLGLGGLAVGGTKQFAALQSGMQEVFTLLPGISQGAMDDMTGQVKDFSKKFGVLPDEVVPALYQALSAGVPPDNVFSWLETAQKAAKGGVTDLETAVDGISSVVNAYGEDTVNATQASDLMFTAVKLGKTTFSELSDSLFNVIPTASALGVKFGDVTGALAAMTAQGVPTSVATTQLRQLLVELSKDGTKTSMMFQELSGKSFKEFIAGGGDVQGALALMEKGAKKNGKSISDMFGSVEAGAAALTLTGKGSKKFTDSLAGMADSSGATDAAFKTMDKGLSNTWAHIKATAAVSVADFGKKIEPIVADLADLAETLLPKVVDGATLFAGALVGVVKVGGKVVGFLQDHKTTAALLLGGIVALIAVTQLHAAVMAVSAAGGMSAWLKQTKLISGATKVWTAVQWAFNAAMAANPLVLVAALLIALGVALFIAWKKSEKFREVVTGALDAVKHAGKSVGAWFSQKLPHYFQVAWDHSLGWVIKKGGEIVAWVEAAPGKAKAGLSGLKASVSGAFHDAMDAGRDKVTSIGGSIIGWIVALPGKITGQAGSGFSKAGRELLQGFIDGMKNAAGVIEGIAGSVWTAVKGLLNGAIDQINAALEFTIKLPGPDLHVDLPNIPHLATGGRANGGVLAVIGEGREPETVLPDSLLRGLLERVHSAGERAGLARAGREGPLIGKVVQQPGESADELAERLWFKTRKRG